VEENLDFEARLLATWRHGVPNIRCYRCVVICMILMDFLMIASIHILLHVIVWCVVFAVETATNILCILGRRFALTPTAYKYLDIGISVGLVSSVEMLLGNNKGNRIIKLPHAIWKIFIVRRADIEKLLQSTAPVSLSIRDLVIGLIKIHDADIMKLTFYDTCMYMKPATIFNHIRTLYWACIFRAMSEYAHGQ